MATVQELSPAEITSKLLSALGIKRVISIDDYNDALADPSPVAEAMVIDGSLVGRTIATLSTADAGFAADAQAFDASEPEAVADLIRENWHLLTATSRYELLQAARESQGMDHPGEIGDLEAPRILEEFLSESADFVRVSLQQWRETAASHLADETPVLILIDRSFENEAGGTDRTGEDLLGDILSRDLPYVQAGLLTRFAEDEEGELALTDALRASFEAYADRVVAIGKFRLRSIEQFPSAIRALLLVSEIRDFRRFALSALETAHGEVLKHFSGLRDQSLIGAIAAAQKEGTFELEHPLRLAQRRYQHVLMHQVRDVTFVEEILSRLRTGNVARFIESGTAGAQVRELLHADVFEPDSFFNELGLPIEVGDVFARYWFPQGDRSEPESAKLTYFVLLAQPCDLSMRANGQRNVNADLVLHRLEKIDYVDWEKHPQRKAKYHALGRLFVSDQEDHGVNFTSSLTVPPEAVDATVFRADGRAIISSTPDPRPMAGGWELRGKGLIEFANKAINKFATAQKTLKNATAVDEHLMHLAASYGRGSSEKGRGVSVRIDCEAKTLEFGLQRVARIRSDVAVNIAALALNYAGRPAFEAATTTG